MFFIKHKLLTLFFILLGITVGLIFFAMRNNGFTSQIFFTSPTPTSVIPTPDLVQTSNMVSPDGTKTLIMKKQAFKTYVEYSFSVSEKTKTDKPIFFSKKEPLSQTMSIPHNTWSVNSLYLFLQETTPSINNYYVFSTQENKFSNGEKYLNIQTLFSQKVPGYTILDVTGWAGATLLIVNVEKNGQPEKKVSFWFDVSSQSFIQLSTYFR